jgi:hypothetical protein
MTRALKAKKPMIKEMARRKEQMEAI